MKGNLANYSKAALCSLALVAGSTQAYETANGIYVAPTLSMQTFDDDLRQKKGFSPENNAGFGIALGYQFDSPWAVELAYHLANPDLSKINTEARAEYFHIDGIYQFSREKRTSPYLVFGLGREDYQVNNTILPVDDNTTQLNAGLGIRHAFTSNIHLRADARLLVGEREEVGSLMNIGLVWVFGSSKYSGGSNDDAERKAAAERAAQAEAARKAEEEAARKAAEEQAEPLAAVVPDEYANDLDRDGVTNDKDQCPETRADMTVTVDGCDDSDGDGVTDKLDKCIGTKAGAKVDADGCYEVLTENVNFNLEVKFSSGSANLAAGSERSINDLAEFLTQYPTTNVAIEGHSDSQGAAAFNKALSQKRADTVKQVLVDTHNIDASRITATGYGEEQPIADNATAAGRAKNRRVIAEIAAQVTKQQ